MVIQLSEALSLAPAGALNICGLHQAPKTCVITIFSVSKSVYSQGNFKYSVNIWDQFEDSECFESKSKLSVILRAILSIL